VTILKQIRNKRKNAAYALLTHTRTADSSLQHLCDVEEKTTKFDYLVLRVQAPEFVSGLTNTFHSAT
jgi:hypothetical protein